MEPQVIYGKLNPAEILLNDYLSLIALEPNLNEWENISFKDSPLRYYRFQRIKSCFQALGMDPKLILTMRTSQSLKDFTESEMKSMENILLEGFSLNFNAYVKDRNSEDFTELFTGCFKILMNMDRLGDSFDGILAASNHHLTPLLINDQVIEKYDVQKKTIKKALIYILNKHEITFTHSELIEQFDFPDVDINAIDLG